MIMKTYIKGSRFYFLSVLLFCTLFSDLHAFAQSITPFPNEVKTQKGVFYFSDTISVNTGDSLFTNLIPEFISSISRYASLKVIQKKKSFDRINF